jgi:hypothetical protein
MPQLMESAARAAEMVEGEPVDMMQPFPGCHPLFAQADFVSRMQVPTGWKQGDDYPEYKGTAQSIFALLMADAIPGAPVSSHEVLKYQEAHFSNLTSGEAVKWKHAITVVVAEGDASSYDPAAPALRKISMDKVVFAFLLELKKRLRKVEGGCIPLGFLRAARHVPVNYVLIPASAAHEEHVYVYAMQIMEDFRTAEEEHAPTAWALCQMWATARAMKQKAGAASEDSAGAVAEMLQKIRCGKTCDYAEKGLIVKRVVQDALTLHDRVLAAGVGDSLSYAGAEFGPRSPLTNMSKLVKLSQQAQATALSRKAVPAVLLRRTVQVMLLRLELSLTDVQEGIGCLGKTEIPRCILVGELLAEAAALLPSRGQPATVTDVLLALGGASVPKPSVVEAAAREALHPPVKAGLSWVTKVLMGNLDNVLREIVHQDTKKTSAKQLLMHGKLGWADDVQPKLDSDAEARQRQAVATAAAARGLAADDQEAFVEDVLSAASAKTAPSAAPLADDAAGGGAGAAEKAADAENPSAKSIVLFQQASSPAEVRAAYAKSQLDKFLLLDVVPALGAPVGDWATQLAKIAAECFGISRDGVQLHGWVLDAASDAEPVLQEREDVFARAPLVDKFLAERFFEAAGRVTPQGNHFLLLAPARGEGDVPTLLKIMTAKPFEEAAADHLTIVYKEKEKGRAGKRFRTKLVERVLGFASKTAAAAAAAAPLNKRCNRLFFTATSTMSDCIVNAPPPAEEHQPRLTLELKAKIMTPGGMLRGEDSESKAADLCSLLHHEKAPVLWAEMFHHYRMSSVATATPGAGAMLKGAISLEIRAAALCKNEEHKAFLLEQLLAWAVLESRRPFSWCYRSDADLGMKETEGLPGDVEEVDDDVEEEGEEEDLAEEDAEEEEAESEEEEPPARAKAKKRAAAKQAAATSKASAAEAKRNAKAEGKAQRKEGEAQSRKVEATRNKKAKAEGLAEPPGKAGSGKVGVKRSAREAGLQEEEGEPAADQLCKAGLGKTGGKKRSPQEAAELEEALRPLMPGGKLGSKLGKIRLKQPGPAAASSVSCPAGALAAFRSRVTGRGGGFLPRL